MIYNTPDLDVIYYGDNQISPQIDKTIYVLTTSDPNHAGHLLAKSIIGSRSVFGKVLSKWFYDSTIGTTDTREYETEEIGSSLYRINRSKYLLTIPQWRPINIKDPSADWIYLYPLVSSIAKWLNQEGFTRMVMLSSQIIHSFVEDGEWPVFSPEKVYVYAHSYTAHNGDKGDNNVKSDFIENEEKQDMLMHPATYMIPKIYHELFPSAEVLNVFVGSSKLGSIDLTAAETLATWLKENEKLYPSKSHLIKEHKELELLTKKYGGPSSETIIRSKGDPVNTNGSVMFG